MFMHIAVEKDVNSGLLMMKYAVNHSKNFVNYIPPFILGYALFQISVIVEINVILIMSSMEDVFDVTMKYIGLAAIVNIPRIYFGSVK